LLARYVPVILTSLPGVVYCAFALKHISVDLRVNWSGVLPNLVLVTVVLAIVFPLTIKAARRFDRWLITYTG
jgi:hypothetical protein